MAKRDLEILESALSGEHFGISAYDAALSLGVLGEGAAALARVFQDHHRYHAKVVAEHIEASGGRPSEPKSWNEYSETDPPPKLETEQDVLRYAMTLEHSAAAADAKAVGELESAELRTLFARIGAVEAMHLAVLRQAVGEPPVPGPLLSEIDPDRSSAPGEDACRQGRQRPRPAGWPAPLRAGPRGRRRARSARRAAVRHASRRG